MPSVRRGRDGGGRQRSQPRLPQSCRIAESVPKMGRRGAAGGARPRCSDRTKRAVNFEQVGDEPPLLGDEPKPRALARLANLARELNQLWRLSASGMFQRSINDQKAMDGDRVGAIRGIVSQRATSGHRPAQSRLSDRIVSTAVRPEPDGLTAPCCPAGRSGHFLQPRGRTTAYPKPSDHKM